MRLNVKDFPEHGILLIGSSDPLFDDLKVKLPKAISSSVDDSYSIFLKNAGSQAVVGYSIRWKCFDDKGDVPDRDESNDRNITNIISYIFLHGDESDRRAVVNRSQDIIKPGSVWLISFGCNPRPLVELPDKATLGSSEFDEIERAETLKRCASVTVIADGIFFDDGTFIGPDEKGFFSEVKTQMDARYEILLRVQKAVAVGENPAKIFEDLEEIRDKEGGLGSAQPTLTELHSYFRSLFARDVLGRKELWGIEKAIEDVQAQLSKPWVELRKL